MPEQILLILGAAMFGLLGTVHLVYTFFTPKFDPRDAAVADAMKSTSPRISRELTMWQAWVGFNASHSLGAMVFAVLVLLLAGLRMDVVRDMPVFAWVAAANALAWFAVGRKYWFRIPIAGLAFSSLCFVAAAVRLTWPG